MTCCSERKDDSPCYECLLESVQRVRELHKSYLAISGQTVCEKCWDGEYNKDNFPCDTIKALDGEQ